YVRANLNTETLKKVKNLYEWCTKELDDGFKNPSCKVVYKDSLIGADEYEIEDVKVTANSNNFRINVNGLELNKEFDFRLEETVSLAATTEIKKFALSNSLTPPDLSINAGASRS